MNYFEGISEMMDVECVNFINVKFVFFMEYFELFYLGIVCLELVNIFDEIFLMIEVLIFKKLLVLNFVKV